MGSLSRSKPRPPIRVWLPYFVLAVSILLTAIATRYVAVTAEAKDNLRFQVHIQQAQASIENRLETYMAMLRAGAGLFDASDEVTRSDFKAYVDRLELQEHYPGIQGVGFSARVKPKERAALTARMRRQGVKTFHIWPADERDEYHSIIYLEPQDLRNQAAVGFDMFSNPTRRAAMERARDRGIAAASGKVKLVQEIDENIQAGFLIYFPVYRKDMPISTEQERREALQGFIYSPFRADDLLKGILGDDFADIAVQIYDGAGLSTDQLLHDSDSDLFDGSYTPRFTSRATLDVAGRVWSLAFFSRPQFELASSRGSEDYILLIGLLGSLLLFVVTRSEARARVTAEQIAAELGESEKERNQILVREQEARRQAEAANRLKDEFLATVSHELRTPLNAILGWSHLLRTSSLDPATVSRALVAIENNARSQAQIVEDILDVSRIIAGKLRIDVRRVSLESVIEAAIDAVQLAADAKSIKIEKSLDPAVGKVLGDADRLQQVVWNLLSNAIKFTQSGGLVRVHLERVEGPSGTGPQAQITITDTGEGIKQEFLPYIFDRFSQGDSSMTRRHGGLGLGLALVRHLVEMHGGTVRADSQGEGKGASITVRLPLVQIQAVGGESRTEEPSIEDTASLRGLRVLVVDDESETREMLNIVLARYGAEVETCASTGEALEKLERWAPAILLSDIAMPGEDGYVLIDKVRSLGPDRGGRVPAVALTALAGIEDSNRAISAGYHVHLSKPVDPSRLVRVIVELTGSKRKAG